MGRKRSDYKVSGIELVKFEEEIIGIFMSAELSDFIKAVFRKQPITLKYKDQDYKLTILEADVNNRIAVEYFYKTINDTVSLIFQEDPAPIEPLMKLYMRLQSSLALNTKVPRIIRRGTRKFDVRTLASRTSNENFREHLTFAQLPYPNKILDASERYKYLINKIKLQEGNNTDDQQLFEKAIYIKNVLDTDFNQDEYYNYLDTIINKLDEWEKIENTFIEGKTEEELDLILEGKGRASIREAHDRFLKKFGIEFNNPLFQKLYFELEGLYYWFWENVFLSAYAEINSLMSEVERRAYILLYTRQGYLDFHIPLFEQLTNEFAETLTVDESVELIVTLLFGLEDGNGEMIEKYNTKFSYFLKFYPIWMDIIRLDENMKDEEIALILYESYIPKIRITGTLSGEKLKREFPSIFESINKINDSFTLEEILPNENLTIEEYDYLHLMHLIETKLSDNEREVIELLYFDRKEYTQTTLALELGISQSAVNQRLKSALIKLKISLSAL